VGPPWWASRPKKAWEREENNRGAFPPILGTLLLPRLSSLGSENEKVPNKLAEITSSSFSHMNL